MSLTSYRAAPPRDKSLRAFSQKTEMDLANAWGADPVRRLPEKATRAKAPGRERYVPTPMRFGKARERSFREFMTAKTRYFRAKSPGYSALARSSAKAQPRGQQNKGGYA